jgi:hypothetical protein
VNERSVWALVENLLCGFPSSGGRCSFRPRVRQRPRRGRTQGRRARFTPLDGTLPMEGSGDQDDAPNWHSEHVSLH